MFCWNELPELLLVDDLFDSHRDQLHSLPTIISEDEDEDWDDEEYEDEDYEDEEYEDDEEFEEGDEESDEDDEYEDEYEDDDVEEDGEEWEEVDEESDEEYEYEDEGEDDEWEDEDDEEWEDEDDSFSSSRLNGFYHRLPSSLFPEQRFYSVHVNFKNCPRRDTSTSTPSSSGTSARRLIRSC